MTPIANIASELKRLQYAHSKELIMSILTAIAHQIPEFQINYRTVKLADNAVMTALAEDRAELGTWPLMAGHQYSSMYEIATYNNIPLMFNFRQASHGMFEFPRVEAVQWFAAKNLKAVAKTENPTELGRIIAYEERHALKEKTIPGIHAVCNRFGSVKRIPSTTALTIYFNSDDAAKMASVTFADSYRRYEAKLARKAAMKPAAESKTEMYATYLKIRWEPLLARYNALNDWQKALV